MATADDLVNEAVMICHLAREFISTDSNFRPPGEQTLIRTRSSESMEQHQSVGEDLLDEIKQWEEHVQQARESGELPPSAASAGTG